MLKPQQGGFNSDSLQRWANSVLMTEYEYEYYSTFQKWPNTNIIRLSKNDRIRIRILFDFPKMTEYEYEYYSAFQKWPNTNTNTIQLFKNDQRRIHTPSPSPSFYTFAVHCCANTKINIICVFRESINIRIRIRSFLESRIIFVFVFGRFWGAE